MILVQRGLLGTSPGEGRRLVCATQCLSSPRARIARERSPSASGSAGYTVASARGIAHPPDSARHGPYPGRNGVRLLTMAYLVGPNLMTPAQTNMALKLRARPGVRGARSDARCRHPEHPERLGPLESDRRQFRPGSQPGCHYPVHPERLPESCGAAARSGGQRTEPEPQRREGAATR